MADWAELQQDLLIQIAGRLPSIESYERFGAVCRSWRAAAKTCRSWRAAAKTGHLNQTCFESPWLMLAEKNDEQQQQQQSGMREFCCLSLFNKIHKLFLPEASKKRCLSCKDWLFVVAEDEIHTSLLHPLTRVQIHLPKLNTFPDYDSFVDDNLHFVEKVVLSADPSSNSDVVIMVIWGGYMCQLGFCRPGDTSWIPMDLHDAGFNDIIYCNNKLYALDWRNRIIISDIHGPNPTHLNQVFDLGPPEEHIARTYLVHHFAGRFIVVHRETDPEEKENYKTRRVKVLEVNVEDGSWLEVNDLGNKALFLGYNTSFSTECSRYNNLKPNCIYFSDDLMEEYISLDRERLGTKGGRDMFIYYLSDGRIERIFDDIEYSVVTPPTWIGPSF